MMGSFNVLAWWTGSRIKSETSHGLNTKIVTKTGFHQLHSKFNELVNQFWSIPGLHFSSFLVSTERNNQSTVPQYSYLIAMLINSFWVKCGLTVQLICMSINVASAGIYYATPNDVDSIAHMNYAPQYTQFYRSSRQYGDYDDDDDIDSEASMLPMEGYGIIPELSGHIDDDFMDESHGAVESILGRRPRSRSVRVRLQREYDYYTRSAHTAQNVNTLLEHPDHTTLGRSLEIYGDELPYNNYYPEDYYVYPYGYQWYN